MSDVPDYTYGKNMAVFNIPSDKLNIADDKTTIEFIKKYDITCWEEAEYDEYVEMGLEYFDWEEYKNGKITDEEAYQQIPYLSWAEVMEHPDNYQFVDNLKEQGFDGYCFTYCGGCYPTYYLIFDIKKALPYITNNTIKENINMKQNKIRLTESQLNKVISDSVYKILNENNNARANANLGRYLYNLNIYINNAYQAYKDNDVQGAIQFLPTIQKLINQAIGEN